MNVYLILTVCVYFRRQTSFYMHFDDKVVSSVAGYKAKPKWQEKNPLQYCEQVQWCGKSMCESGSEKFH